MLSVLVFPRERRGKMPGRVQLVQPRSSWLQHELRMCSEMPQVIREEGFNLPRCWKDRVTLKPDDNGGILQEARFSM